MTFMVPFGARAARGLRRQPVRRRRQRPAVEPARSRSSPTPAWRCSASPACCAAAAGPGAIVGWRAGLGVGRLGAADPARPSRRSTCSPPSRVGAAAYSFRDRIVLSWPVAPGACWWSACSPLWARSLRVVVWTVAAVYLSYWFAYALPPDRPLRDPVRRRVVRRLHLGVPRAADHRPGRRRRASSPWALIGVATPDRLGARAAVLAPGRGAGAAAQAAPPGRDQPDRSATPAGPLLKHRCRRRLTGRPAPGGRQLANHAPSLSAWASAGWRRS